jgi:hypothetical protein
MAGLYERQNIFRTRDPNRKIQCHFITTFRRPMHCITLTMGIYTWWIFRILLVTKLSNYSEQDNAVLYLSHLGRWLKGLEVTTIHTRGKIIKQRELFSVILSTPVTRRDFHSRRVSTIWLFQMNSFENKFPNKLHCDFRGKNNYAVTK